MCDNAIGACEFLTPVIDVQKSKFLVSFSMDRILFIFVPFWHDLRIFA